MTLKDFIRIGHAGGGALAILLILAFQGATLATELSGDAAAILTAKTAIVRAMALLILALAAAGASGFWLSGGKPRGMALRKLARMKAAAAVGIVILVPAALFLAMKASHGAFDAAFYGVQGVEIVAGLTNLLLIGLNMRDGIRMNRNRRAQA